MIENHSNQQDLSKVFPFIAGDRPPQIMSKEINGERIAVSDVFQVTEVPTNR